MSKKPEGIAGWFDSIRADYDATKQSRFIRRRTGVAPQGGSADYHFREEIKYYELIEQARDMDRNDGLVGTLADRRVDNIVQQGFTLDTKTGDKGLDRELWERWDEFANDPERCDIAGELCWHEIERLVCRAESIDGDIVVLGTEEGSFQTIEAHAIQTSSREENTFLGVTRNLYGRRDQYHVRYDLNQFGQKSSSIPIDVRNADGLRQLFHVYNPKRVSVTRGVTQLAPVFSLSGMLEDINFAKLVQQQIVSCFAIFRKMAANSDELPSVAGIYGEAGSEVNPAGTRQLEGISPGMEIVGRAGEELQGFSPNVPNSEYFQQVKLILQIIGVNFGLPLCLVLMDGSETNFSGWRGAVDEARKGFVADQQNLVRRLHAPAYLWWLNREISLDNSLKKAARRDGINIESHKWNLPTWSYIEPVADAEGDLKQLQGALTSPRRMHAARGKDWEEISEEIIADNFYAISRAQKQAEALNKQFPNGPMLTWRDLIPLPMQAGATLAMQDPAAVKQEDEESDAPPKKPAAKGKRKPVASEFDESKIKRDDDGKFGSGGGGGKQTQQNVSTKSIEGSTPSEWREKRELPDGWFVHGRAGRQDLQTSNVLQLTQDWDVSEQYAGQDGSEWMITPSKNASIADMADEEIAQQIASKFLQAYKNGELSPELDDIAASIREDDIESFLEELNPDDIVDSAKMWDSREFCAWVYDTIGIDFVTVDSGAIVLNKGAIESEKAAGSKKNERSQAKGKRKPVASEFDESKVTRDDDGTFSEGGGGKTKVTATDIAKVIKPPNIRTINHVREFITEEVQSGKTPQQAIDSIASESLETLFPGHSYKKTVDQAYRAAERAMDKAGTGTLEIDGQDYEDWISEGGHVRHLIPQMKNQILQIFQAKGKRKPVASEFDESKITRDDDGTFSESGGGGGSSSKPEKKKSAAVEKHEAAVAATEQKYADRAKKAEQSHAEAVAKIDAAVQAVEADHESQLQAIDAKHESEVAEMEARHKEAEAAAELVSEEELDKVVDENIAERDALADKHEADREKFEDKLNAKFEAVEEKAAEKKDALDDKLSEKLDELESQKDDAIQELTDKAIAETEERHAKETEKLEAKHESEREELERKIELMLQALEDKQAAELEKTEERQQQELEDF
jgi:lambda family phage portal protein